MEKDKGLKMKYFVLKPEGNSQHARASRLAMRAYAAAIKPYDESLSISLYKWSDTEFNNQLNGSCPKCGQAIKS